MDTMIIIFSSIVTAIIIFAHVSLYMRSSPDVYIEVQERKLKGKENTSVLNGKKYYSFLGIPYAKPPVEGLRFKAPVLNEKWYEINDATEEGNPCIQMDYFITQEFIGSEDCLFINVHTPQIPANIKAPKAVLVFIHGGGFFTGYGSQKLYSADFLITQDIILVTFNYRLHIFGFLNLGIPDCPGNAGLKDQQLALRWIKENIAKFGGDPNNITISGESAGASSVHFQIISPLSRGFFNKAILQSGSALAPWAMTFNPTDMAKRIAERLGFQGGSAQQVLDFLKMQSSDKLTHEVMAMTEDLKKRYPGRCTSIPFSPSVETIKNGAFLPELPQKLLETTPPLPIIYGANNKEGLLLFSSLADNIIPLVKNDFSLVLRSNFKIDPALLPTLSAKVKQYYFGDKEIGMETIESFVDLYTDLYFYQMYEAIDFVTKTQTPAYVYEFSYDGDFNTLKKIIMSKLGVTLEGAAHGDEIGYLYYPKVNRESPRFEGNNLVVINKMITLWADFAKNGVPTDELTWAPSTSSQPRYLKIDSKLTLTNGKVFGERLQFLKDTLGPKAKPNDIFHN